MSTRKVKPTFTLTGKVVGRCNELGCGRTWDGKRARAAAQAHATNTGHPVEVHTHRIEGFGGGWAAFILRQQAKTTTDTTSEPNPPGPPAP